MTTFRLLVALLVLSATSLAAAGESKVVTGFQKAKFGFSYDEVKAVFPGISSPDYSPGKKATATATNLRLVGKPAAVSFRFYQDKLYEAVVVILIDRSADDAYMAEFFRIEKLLEKAYGASFNSSKRRETLGNTDVTSMKIKTGDLTWFAQFGEKNEGSVTLQLSGNNYKEGLLMFYTDNVADAAAQSATSDAQADEL